MHEALFRHPARLPRPSTVGNDHMDGYLRCRRARTMVKVVVLKRAGHVYRAKHCTRLVPEAIFSAPWVLSSSPGLICACTGNARNSRGSYPPSLLRYGHGLGFAFLSFSKFGT